MDETAIGRIRDAIGTIRCGAADTEAALHGQVYAALAAAGYAPVHEARLGPRCRIDFLVEDLGIEVKKSRPDPVRLTQQLARYAACGQIGTLMVIAPRGVNLPKSINGVPVVQIALERLWGISLP